MRSRVSSSTWRKTPIIKRWTITLGAANAEPVARLIQGRTVFAIAHRLSTLRRASRLFAIEEGRLVEAGTHQELLAMEEGVYRKLYELQLQLQ